MAERFSLRELAAWLLISILIVIVVYALAYATGCAAGNTGIDASDTMRTAATAAGTGATAISIAGAGPWCCAGALAALWLFTWFRKRTAVGALDRVVRAIESEDGTKHVKSAIQAAGLEMAAAGDAAEHLIRKRLARMKSE